MGRKPYSSPSPDRLYVEGNRGGSFVAIETTNIEGLVRLEVGSQCTVVIDRTVKVVDLAELLDKAIRAWPEMLP